MEAQAVAHGKNVNAPTTTTTCLDDGTMAASQTIKEGVGEMRSRFELMQEKVVKEAVVFAVCLKNCELMVSMGCKLNATQLQNAVNNELVSAY